MSRAYYDLSGLFSDTEEIIHVEIGLPKYKWNAAMKESVDRYNNMPRPSCDGKILFKGVTGDERIFMGLAKYEEVPVFMSNDDCIVPHMYAYMKQSTKMDMILLDTNGNGQFESHISRSDIDSFILRSNNLSQRIVSSAAKGDPDADLSPKLDLYDVTDIVEPCRLFLNGSHMDILTDFNPLTKGNNQFTVQGWFLQEDPIEKFFDRVKRILRMPKKITEHLNHANFKMYSKGFWMKGQIHSDMFEKFDAVIVAVTCKKEETKLKQKTAEENALRTSMESAKLEKERTAMLVRVHMERLDNLESTATSHKGKVSAQKKKKSTAQRMPSNRVCQRRKSIKEACARQISIEQARQHEANLKEREIRRVEELNERLRIVCIGDAIQKGT